MLLPGGVCGGRGGRCGLSKIRKKLEWGGGGDKARKRGLNAEVHRILCGHMHVCSGKKEPTPWWWLTQANCISKVQCGVTTPSSCVQILLLFTHRL